MEITLTQTVLDEIRTQSSKAVNEAWAVRESARLSFEAAEEELAKARERQTNAFGIKAGSKFAITLDGGPNWGAKVEASLSESIEEKDPRPLGWEGNFGWSFPSRSKSGGEGHQVCIGAHAQTSCNCKAGSFGSLCWAQKAVQSAYGHGESPRPFTIWDSRPRVAGVIGTRISPFTRPSGFGLVIKPKTGVYGYEPVSLG